MGVGVQWQRLSRCDSDAPRAWHTAVVAESPSGSATRMITFGGEVAEPDATSFNDVAVFDLTDQIWFTPPVTGTPPTRRAVCTTTTKARRALRRRAESSQTLTGSAAAVP